MSAVKSRTTWATISIVSINWLTKQSHDSNPGQSDEKHKFHLRTKEDLTEMQDFINCLTIIIFSTDRAIAKSISPSLNSFSEFAGT